MGKQRPNYNWAGRVTVPYGKRDGAMVVPIFVDSTENEPQLRQKEEKDRATRPGVYTALYADATLWMSDTDAEYADHRPLFERAESSDCRRVLINGLGLGMCIEPLLQHDHIENIVVVERDPRIVRLVAPHYLGMDDRVEVVSADAFDPPGEILTNNWDAVWHDIWSDCEPWYMQQANELVTMYEHNAAWQGVWAHESFRKAWEEMEAIVATFADVGQERLQTLLDYMFQNESTTPELNIRFGEKE